MEPAKRKGRPGDQEHEAGGPPADPPPPPPDVPRERRKGGKKSTRPELRKLKLTVSLYEDLHGRLHVTAAVLNIDVCDLLDAICRPALKGFSAPTIPDGLKALLPRGNAPAS